MQDAITMLSSFIALLLQFQKPKKTSYLVTLSCFIYKMKLNKCCSKYNLDGCLKLRYHSLVELAWLIMIWTTSCTNSSNSSKRKLTKVLNKLTIVHMVTMMSYTLILGLTNCPPFSSNSISVKYSQVLMYAIATSFGIQSFASISSSSFSLLFEELNLWFKNNKNSQVFFI
jgi:hypothetical protein